MKFLLLIFLVLFIKSDDVTKLTKDNFDQFIKDNKVVLVKFYAPWCGHCKTMAPEFIKAAKTLEPLGVKLGDVDATVETELGTKYDVQGFPTLFVFKDGVKSKYEGGRTSETIVQYMKAEMLGDFESIEESELAKKLQEENVVFVLHGGVDHHSQKAFDTVAAKHKKEYKFIKVNKSSKNNLLECYKKGKLEEENANMDETKDEASAVEKIKSLIGNVAFELVGEIGPDNYKQQAERDLPFIWLLMKQPKEGKGKEEFDKSIEDLKVAAKDFKNKFSFVYLDGEKYQGQTDLFGIKELPGLALSTTQDEKFVFSGAQNSENIIKWLKEQTEGKLSKFLKSEPVPEKNDEPVRRMVGSMFKEEVIDTQKDVLILLHAPWCGHCQKMMPDFDKLGKAFAKNDNIVIAKMDATANDVESPAYKITGFPSLFFAKKGKGSEPMKQDGGREYQGMVDFIVKNNSFDIKEAPEAPKEEKKEEKKDEKTDL